MLYRDNVHAGRAGYQAHGSRSMTQVPTNIHCYVVIGYPRNYQIRIIKLIRGSNILNKTKLRNEIAFYIYLYAQMPRTHNCNT